MKTQFGTGVHLSEHFTLREMVASGKAIERRIENIPTADDVERLRLLCVNLLEPLRRRFGRLIVSSGYRCAELNAAVGGVKNSQHMRGEAADLHCSSVERARQIYDYVLQQGLDFDQMLLERRLRNGCCWLHLSYVGPTAHRANRRKAQELNV